jgi:RNA polymerase sigma factor (sigma-70 family)
LDRFVASQHPVADADRGAVTPEVAVSWLFQRHHATLVRVAYAMLGTREAAEDAVQDAFVSLFRQWSRLRDPMAAEAYLRSAVLNRCRSGIRERVRERTSAVPTPLQVGTPEESAQRHQDAVLVGRALRQLPRRQAEAVACRYLLELTVAETAETLGISDGAVKRHTHRGLRALHAALEVTR